MTALVNDDLKEMLSFKTALALLCFNINYAGRYEIISLKKLSFMLGLPADELEKASRIFSRIGMAKVYHDGRELKVEMTDAEDTIIKNTIFQVIWDNKLDYSMIYKQMMKNEIGMSMGA
jgi:hypothetical protein